jgi:hypothetical protein
MSQSPAVSSAVPPRPTILTVAAIIGIAFGALGVVCTPFSAIPYFVEMGPRNPVIDAIKGSTWMYAYMLASLLLGFLFACVLLTGSIGALLLKPWARLTLMGYAIASLALGVVSTVVMALVFVPLTRELGDPAQFGAMMGGVIGAACGLCFAVLLQGGLLFVLTRPEVKRAFGLA